MLDHLLWTRVLPIEKSEAPVLSVGGGGGGGGGLILVIIRHHPQGEGRLVGPDRPDLPGGAVVLGAVPKGLATVSVPGEQGVVGVGPAPASRDVEEILPALGVSDVNISAGDSDGVSCGGWQGPAHREVTSRVLRLLEF